MSFLHHYWPVLVVAGAMIAICVWMLRSLLKGGGVELPPIVAFVGPPGEGKTYCMTWWLLRQMKREGRLCLTQFAVDGAIPLIHLHDLLHPMAGGACVGLDEIGRLFPAREWKQEEEIEMLWIETLRHWGQTLVFAGHAPQDVAVHMRRRVGLWIVVSRDGPDPSVALTLGKPISRKDMPRGFKLEYYGPAEPPDYIPSFAEKNRLHEAYIPFSMDIALRYDTGERILTDAQEKMLEELLIGAEERLTAPAWKVIGGKAESAGRRLVRGRDRVRAQKEREAREAASAQQVANIIGSLATHAVDPMAASLARQNTATARLNGGSVAIVPED
jgi:hypothetical protein